MSGEVLRVPLAAGGLTEPGRPALGHVAHVTLTGRMVITPMNG